MQLQKIIAAGLFGLLIAFWQESLVAFYLTCLGCKLMYAFRMFSISLSGRDSAANEGDDSALEGSPMPARLFFAVASEPRRGKLNKPGQRG